MYPQLARLQGCDAVQVALREDDDFAVAPQRIVDACSDSVSVVFLCSPNNPTGRAMPLNDIRTVCQALEHRALVVVDEAYAEFSTHHSATTLLAQTANLVVLRTLSKAYGLAAARVGAAVGRSELIAVVDRLLMPFPLPAASADAALVQTAPDALARLHKHWQVVLDERARLTQALSTRQSVRRVWPSDANFLLLSCDQPDVLVAHCHARGLLVRLIRGAQRNYVRVTVGQPQENDQFLGALAEQAA
jgi:histidinol-phosphate aminotransferase